MQKRFGEGEVRENVTLCCLGRGQSLGGVGGREERGGCSTVAAQIISLESEPALHGS